VSPDDLLDYFHIPTLPGVYVVGCLEPRVTIHDQQVRAVNLVWALHKSRRLRRGDRLAIVGGGFAGLSAAIAAKTLGLDPVVFDRLDAPCALQATSSRRIDPRLYDWPRDGWNGPHAVPLLSWSAGEAREVVNQVRERWSRHGIPFRGQAEVMNVESTEHSRHERPLGEAAS
jgi:NADPH-dependent 2,4-dienoyl-CoA reductase/sulfur reductase-like enzyme